MESSNNRYKFRAWDKDYRKWLSCGNLKFVPQQADGYFHIISEDDHIVVMQYTGLKDKNGKDIYEGDIVRGIMGAGAGWSSKPGKPCLFQIKVLCGGLGEKYYPEQITKITGDYRAYPNFNEVEIIGNIYENPELLK